MTNQEFINALSPKAKQIISAYNCTDSKKRTIVVFVTDNRSQVDVSFPDKYIIEVKENSVFSNMEYALLHEFYHCVQMDENFPNIHAVTSSYTRLASSLSSTVLDLDVNDRLTKAGYPYNSEQLKGLLDRIRKIIVIASNDTSIKNEIHEINQYIYLCSMIAFIRINYNKPDEIEQLLQILKTNAQDFFQTQSAIYNAIKKIGYDTPKKAYKLFKTLIRELELSDYVQIS